jgi:hypothetical protein
VRRIFPLLVVCITIISLAIEMGMIKKWLDLISYSKADLPKKLKNMGNMLFYPLFEPTNLMNSPDGLIAHSKFIEHYSAQNISSTEQLTEIESSSNSLERKLFSAYSKFLFPLLDEKEIDLSNPIDLSLNWYNIYFIIIYREGRFDYALKEMQERYRSSRDGVFENNTSEQ